MTPCARSAPCVAGHGTVLDELWDSSQLVIVEHAAGLAIGRHARVVPKLAILLAGGASSRPASTP